MVSVSVANSRKFFQNVESFTTIAGDNSGAGFAKKV
jgi:hypothetical protein